MHSCGINGIAREERLGPGIILIEQLECNGFSWRFLFEVFMCAQADLKAH